MYYLLGAVAVSCIIYWIVQSQEDTKLRKQNKPLTTASKRALLFFFLVVVTTCLFYFIGNAWNTRDEPYAGGGSVYKAPVDYKSDMVKNIQEQVQTGLPPFQALS